MMMKKKIIVNEIDVSGCKYWKGYCRIASLCDYAGHLCEVTPNCNYKNWKRKEQECEELKEKLENYCYDCDVAERMAEVTYRATGGRLSYSNYTLEAIEQAYNDQLRIDVEYRTKELEEQLDSVVREWEEYTEKYKQVLREIKNLTESQEYVGFWEDCLSEIGRKASEVLDE